MPVEELKKLLEGSTVTAINKTDKRESICEFVVKKEGKEYSFILFATELGAWVGSHKDSSHIFKNFQDFIEEAFLHFSDVENYHKDLYKSVDFPLELAIGFECKKCKKVFKISLTAIKTSEYGDLLQTPDQRKAFAKILSDDYVLSKESAVEKLANLKS